MLDNLKDQELWAGLKAGDKNALLELYKHYYVDLMNFALRLTGDRQLSSDCLSQTLIYLWDKRQQLPVVHHLRAYLVTCLRHEIYSVIRYEKRHRLQIAVLGRFHSEERSYEDQLIESQSGDLMRRMLTEALNGLTARVKELLRLRFFESLDYKTIARRCGIKKRTAYNTIHGALTHLRASLVPSSAAGISAASLISVFLLMSVALVGAAGEVSEKIIHFFQ